MCPAPFEAPPFVYNLGGFSLPGLSEAAHSSVHVRVQVPPHLDSRVSSGRLFLKHVFPDMYWSRPSLRRAPLVARPWGPGLVEAGDAGSALRGPWGLGPHTPLATRAPEIVSTRH